MKKADVIPGTLGKITKTSKDGRPVGFDSYLTLFAGREKQSAIGEEFKIIRGPKKTIDGTNLVKVLRLSDQVEYEMFYCDVRYCTEKQ